ncbi:hypothetical protein T10_12318 [Trichinella papuae]|uniref:Uncharacterized protein n=1 Tax=Trichinella papuae TaxID=268474 RepID=A0A0V1NAR7_9BILA|nr:hypothetical protein T10_12318 [Trichinella papuae]
MKRSQNSMKYANKKINKLYKADWKIFKSYNNINYRDNNCLKRCSAAHAEFLAGFEFFLKN